MPYPVIDDLPMITDILIYAGDSFSTPVVVTTFTPDPGATWEGHIRGNLDDGVAPDATFTVVPQVDGAEISLDPATTRHLYSLRPPLPDPKDFFYSASFSSSEMSLSSCGSSGGDGIFPELPPLSSECGSEPFTVDSHIVAVSSPGWLGEVGLPTYPGVLARGRMLNSEYHGIWDLQVTDQTHGTNVTVVRGRILVFADITRE